MSRRSIEDLSPFLSEQCRLFVLPARAASVAVILRRGPTQWWRASLWDTQRDKIEGGQWFHGRLYPERCDLSPNGELLLYFAGKFRTRDIEGGYGGTYTAASRPPWFTALALWPNGGTWGGGGVFLDDRTVALYQSPVHHPDHPPGPLRVVRHNTLDSQRRDGPCSRYGWSGIVVPPRTRRYSAWRKSVDGLTLERAVSGNDYASIYPPRQGAQYKVYRDPGKVLASFRAHWVDFDSAGNLMAAAGGRIFRGVLRRKAGGVAWLEIASLAPERFVPVIAPDWAQRW